MQEMAVVEYYPEWKRGSKGRMVDHESESEGRRYNVKGVASHLTSLVHLDRVNDHGAIVVASPGGVPVVLLVIEIDHGV